MKSTAANLGRVFILRLEDGEVLNETLETFAREQNIERALVFFVGGAADGSKLVVGPAHDDGKAAVGERDAGRGEVEGTVVDGAVVPLIHTLSGAQETLGVGTLIADEAGQPILHMHAAAGREGAATVGCTRAGMKTWLVGEVVILEILGTQALRKVDPATGFQLLSV